MVQFWTILGVIIALLVGSTTITITLFLRLDTKIDSVATKLDTKIDSVATELRQELRDQTARIDKQSERMDQIVIAMNQVVKDVGELKGYMVVVSERLNIPKSA